MVNAYDVTRFYAMLTFCINLIGNDLFKIVFLFETTFIFPHQPSSRDVGMVCPDCPLAKRFSGTLRGCVLLLTAWCLDIFTMALEIRNFKCYLCCASMENLFTIRIFGNSAKVCTCPCNFGAQLLLIKIPLINATSQIRSRWHPDFQKNQNFQQLFQANRCAFSKTFYAGMFPATWWCILLHIRFLIPCNFIFGTKNGCLQ